MAARPLATSTWMRGLPSCSTCSSKSAMASLSYVIGDPPIWSIGLSVSASLALGGVDLGGDFLRQGFGLLHLGLARGGVQGQFPHFDALPVVPQTILLR